MASGFDAVAERYGEATSILQRFVSRLAPIPAAVRSPAAGPARSRTSQRAARSELPVVVSWYRTECSP